MCREILAVENVFKFFICTYINTCKFNDEYENQMSFWNDCPREVVLVQPRGKYSNVMLYVQKLSPRYFNYTITRYFQCSHKKK